MGLPRAVLFVGGLSSYALSQPRQSKQGDPLHGPFGFSFLISVALRSLSLDSQETAYVSDKSENLGDLPVNSPYHAVLAVKDCAHSARLRPGGRFVIPDCLRCGVLRRSRAIPPEQDRSTIMSHNTLHHESSELLVRDALGQYRLATGDEVLQAARQVIGRRVRRGTSMSSPHVVRDYLRTKLAELEHEVFVALLLDLCAVLPYV